MGIDIERFLDESAKIDLADLAWHEVRHHALSPAVRRTVRYFAGVESSTLFYTRALARTRSWRDPDVAAFVTAWAYEEEFHGRAFRRFLEAAGEAPFEAEERRARFARRSLAERRDELGQALLSLATPAAWPAIHMVWGAIQELTTYHAYVRLGERCRHPVLATLSRRIAKQELRHFAFYRAAAERSLRSSARTQRIVTGALRFGWQPVGIGMSRPEEAHHVLRHLFDGAEGAIVPTIEARVRELPGLGWFDLLSRYVARHRIARAEPAWLPACAADGAEPEPLPVS